MSEPLRYTVVPSPLGPLYAVFGRRGLCQLVFGAELDVHMFLHGLGAPAGWVERDADEDMRRLSDELTAYFACERPAFRTKLDLWAGTPFQRKVWRALRRIPYGKTASYGDIARRVGNPRACRAVGAANGANPVPIIVPCHRVICSNGDLGGFGAGLPIKRWLLRHEGCPVD
jgi:methylated-DNA-[protein]-cysteine S-methyltransferase